jgi:hypothetical protein
MPAKAGMARLRVQAAVRMAAFPPTERAFGQSASVVRRSVSFALHGQSRCRTKRSSASSKVWDIVMDTPSHD